MTGSVAIGIGKLINEKGFSSKHIAIEAGFTAQEFTDMLTGRKAIRAVNLVPIARALGVSVQDIYDAGMDSQPQTKLKC